MNTPIVFSAAEIHAQVTIPDLLGPLAAAMIAVTDNTATFPPRFAAPINENGRMGIMYGSLEAPAIHGAKILSLFPGAPAMGLSSHQGFVVLFDSTDGSPMSICDADAITALRTAAMSMLATKTLAKRETQIITICGAGEQAEWHVRGSLTCFPKAEIRIWARRYEAAQRLAEAVAGNSTSIKAVLDLREAVSGADVIHTTTSSKEAFFCGEWLEPGQHINLVGASLADTRELDNEGVARVRMFTDSMESSRRESGEILEAKRAAAIGSEYPITEIGQVLENQQAGRSSNDEITAYKSHGLILQDLITAHEVLVRCGVQIK